MMLQPNVIDLTRRDFTELSPKEFVELVKKDPGSIKHSEIIPPRLGKRHCRYGRIRVYFKSPYYEARIK